VSIEKGGLVFQHFPYDLDWCDGLSTDETGVAGLFRMPVFY
jgi:hypothetical protein